MFTMLWSMGSQLLTVGLGTVLMVQTGDSGFVSEDMVVAAVDAVQHVQVPPQVNTHMPKNGWGGYIPKTKNTLEQLAREAACAQAGYRCCGVLMGVTFVASAFYFTYKMLTLTP